MSEVVEGVVAAVVTLVAALLTLVAGLWSWGWTRPAGHVATVARTVSAPPEAVWAVLLDYDEHAGWRSTVKQVRRVGARIEETSRRGDVLAMVIEVEEAPRKLVTRIVDQRAFGGTWTCTLAPDGAGTRVEVVERGDIYSPLFRALAPLFHDPEATARTWLEDLARRVG